MERFELYTDEAIVAEAQGGDSDAMDYILVKFKNLVRARAHSYFLVGADHEDIVQEGMIGLYKAVRDYRADRNASFKAFADLCVTRQIINAVKTATRQKHIPLNYYISLNRPAYDGDSDRTLMEALKEDDRSNPEALLITREDISAVKERMDTLQQGLASYEKIKKFVLLPEMFSMDKGELTNTLKIRRNVLVKNYSAEIDAMYEE